MLKILAKENENQEYKLVQYEGRIERERDTIDAQKQELEDFEVILKKAMTWNKFWKNLYFIVIIVLILLCNYGRMFVLCSELIL